MKKAFLIAASALTLVVAGCADGGYYHSGGGVSVAYDGYYDDYYGPFYDGYWGPDGFYYYSMGEGHPFVRDEAHHFRHDAGAGFHGVHGRGGAHPAEHR